MKQINKFALAGLLVANCSVFAATPAEGWYGGFFGGLTYTPSISLNRTPNPAAILLLNSNFFRGLGLPLVTSNPLAFSGFVNGKITHGVGGDFGGQIGYRLCNFRLEGELLYNYSPISLLRVGGLMIKRHVTFRNPINISGQTSFGAGFINLYYDFYDEEDDPTWVPYLGLGVGYGYLRNSTNFSIPYLLTVPVSFTAKHSTSSPFGQFIAGISYYYSDYLSLNLDFRYESTRSIANLGGRIQASALNFGFNYAFAES